MSVSEAEEVVGQLGESGMLDMREGVIDGTTEEGREQLKHIHDEIPIEAGNGADLEGGEPGDIEVAGPD